MASKALKGLTIKIGAETSELTKALDKVEKQSRSLSGELGQINKLLKLDPKNTELLAQKQKVLADAISSTEEQLDTLCEAEKQVQEQFQRGEVSEAQYRAIQREIIATEAKLNKYKNAAKETADAVENLGKEASDAAGDLKDQAHATEKAEDATEDLDTSALDLAKGGLAAVAASAAAAVTAIVALAEESREYRTEMGKLDTAFTNAGHSSEAATKTYEALQSVLGETDQAVEAANHLALLCENEEDLSDWTDILTGVYATFGASLPVEGLAEAANETAKVGQVTGSLADALNWTGISEDEFNESLEACTSEQERQKLITKTLTGLYGDAAEQYKKTNKEVIRANEVTEDWNKATAKIGKTVEPVVTDIKELGVAVMEDASEPLEELADFVRKKVLPAIKDLGSWVKRNLPAIKAGIVGVTAALMAYKAAVFATELASKGLTVATYAQMVAQKALDAVMKASPWGLVLTAVTGLTAALVTYMLKSQEAAGVTADLTKEERELMAAADEAAASFRDQHKATEEALSGVTAQSSYVSDLAGELFNLADASGKVKEEDEARAQFILNELNTALGTEYEMVDGMIQQYDTLTNSIHDLIQAKLANSLLETANADYVAAVQDQARALENTKLKYEDYQAQLEQTRKVEEEYEAFAAEYRENLTSGSYAFNQWGKAIDDMRLANLQAKVENEKALLAETEAAYNESANVYSTYHNTITTYEEAQAAALAGNYQTTIDLLSQKGGAYIDFSDQVDEETAKVLNTLYQEAVDAGLEAERTRENFEKGVDGYTEEMVEEAEKGYNEAMDEFANAYADAEGIGEDLADGMADGAENKRSGLLAKARSLVSGFLEAARNEADSHSPSRKAIAIFEDIGEGAEIGVENKTQDVARAGADQAAALLDAYSTQEVTAQRALRNVAEQQAARQTSGQMAAATANSPMLEKILAAIEKGQVLLLDGDAVVGGTAAKMDNALGRRRALASRGAM